MKIFRYLIVAAFFTSGAALAQSYSAGQKVEAFNSATGKWESATITRADGGSYMLHSDTAGVLDWDVTATQLRQPTGTPPLANDTATPGIGANSSASGSVAGSASPGITPASPNASVVGSASGSAPGNNAGAAGGALSGAGSGQ